MSTTTLGWIQQARIEVQAPPDQSIEIPAH